MRLEKRDPQQARSLHRWIDEKVLPAFDGRILPVTLAVAEHAAPLHVPTKRNDADMLIAATALVHGFTVVTRNVKHCEPTGVRLLNPWISDGGLDDGG